MPPNGRKPKNSKLLKQKSQRGNNKPQRNNDGKGWRRLTRIIDDELEKGGLHFSRFANGNIDPLVFLV